jgi:hypothetical protein
MKIWLALALYFCLPTALASTTAELDNGYARKAGDAKKITVSVVDLDRAQRLFKTLASDKSIPFGYPQEGCADKAIRMAVVAEKENISVGRIVAEGSLQVVQENPLYPIQQWGLHTAPIVYVQGKDGAKEIYVLDPSFFDRPVKVEEWKRKLLSSAKGTKPRIDEIYYGSRFQYDRRSQEENKTAWSPELLGKVDERLKYFMPFVTEPPRLKDGKLVPALNPDGEGRGRSETDEAEGSR